MAHERAMATHVLKFDGKGPVYCAVCTQAVTAEEWASDAPCPGRPKCEPPSMHAFLDGVNVCECRMIGDRDLVNAVTREPIATNETEATR